MSENQASGGPSRRALAKGAAWSVPVIAATAVAPLASASVCVPDFEVDLTNSSKCCNGRVKNMKVALRIVDKNNCLSATSQVCITGVALANNGTIGSTVYQPSACGTENGTIVVFLLNASNCTVNLLVSYSVGGVAGAAPVPIQSGNIPSGNTDGACQPA